ncbi:MAG: hypothetical protein KAV82_04540 [Phycisphaerae bacterium]|nr:hypothetical protein [Phycisphaerae bacterium]
MTDLASPKDVSELVQFITSFVSGRFRETGRRTTGAGLATAIRERFPNFSYEQVGLTRLADAVRRAEKDGGLVRHRDVKHLEVSPSENTPRTTSPLATAAEYVRPDVWRAFVFVGDEDAHFLERATGRLITLTQDSAPEIDAYEKDERYVRAGPIAAETQKQWMRRFVESEESLSLGNAPIDEERWWVAFPAWLEKHNAQNIQAWRRFRAHQVAEFMRKWATENRILVDALFAPPRPPTPPKPVSVRLRAQDEVTKRAIIAVIEDMPFEQLLELAIPVRYMLRHFKAR